MEKSTLFIVVFSSCSSTSTNLKGALFSKIQEPERVLAAIATGALLHHMLPAGLCQAQHNSPPGRGSTKNQMQPHQSNLNTSINIHAHTVSTEVFQK